LAQVVPNSPQKNPCAFEFMTSSPSRHSISTESSNLGIDLASHSSCSSLERAIPPIPVSHSMPSTTDAWRPRAQSWNVKGTKRAFFSTPNQKMKASMLRGEEDRSLWPQRNTDKPPQRNTDKPIRRLKRARVTTEDILDRDDESYLNIPPQYSFRVAKALQNLGLCTESERPCSSSLPSTPRAKSDKVSSRRPTGTCAMLLSLVEAAQSSVTRSKSVAVIDIEDDFDELDDSIDGVPALLAQMNCSSQTVNENENNLRGVRQYILCLDADWKKKREKLIVDIGAHHIQRADPFFTRSREIQHKKDHIMRLTQKYAQLVTLLDQMNAKTADSEKERLWLETKLAKLRKVMANVENQMQITTESVASVQQELNEHSQENSASIRKAEVFFKEYNSYLDKRKHMMKEQKIAELKLTENKEIYRCAMRNLEEMSRRIHEERGNPQKRVTDSSAHSESKRSSESWRSTLYFANRGRTP